MFMTSDEVYASLQADLKIEDDGELNKYLRIYLDLRLDGYIHLWQTYLTQRILNMNPGMENSSAKPTPMVKPPPEKNLGAQSRKINLVIDQ